MAHPSKSQERQFHKKLAQDKLRRERKARKLAKLAERSGGPLSEGETQSATAD